MIKKLIILCYLVLLPIASLCAAESFSDGRSPSLQGSVADGAEHVIIELNPNERSKKVFQVPVVGGQFNQDIPLEPGENKILLKSNSAIKTHVLKTNIKIPSLRFELTWPNGALDYNLHINDPVHGTVPNGGSLDRDWTGGSGHGIENITFPQADAGQYQVYVQYQSDNSTSSSSPTTLNVYLNEKLVGTYTNTISSSEQVSTLSNSTGESVWSVCTVVLNSGEESGGLNLNNDHLESFDSVTLLDKVFPLTPFTGQSLTPASPQDPVQLYVGQSLSFAYIATLDHQGSKEVLGELQLDLGSVGSLDELGNYYASEAGTATVSVAGTSFRTDIEILELSNFIIDSVATNPGQTLIYLEDLTQGAVINLDVAESNALSIPEADFEWLNATSTTGTAATFPLGTITEHLHGERVYAFLGGQHYIDLNIIVLDPLQDTDNDGLTDWEEVGPGGHQTNRLVADSDADGMNDGDEVDAGRDPNAKEWTVTFDLDGKATLNSGDLVQVIADGGAATAPTITPNTGFVFNSWDQEFNVVEQSITVTAIFDIGYVVTFQSGLHGTITSGDPIQTVVAGQGAVAPTITADTANGWYFDGWDVDFSDIQADLTVTAQYIDGYDVTFEIIGAGTGSLTHTLIQNIPPGGTAGPVTVTVDSGSYLRAWSTGEQSTVVTVNDVNENMTVKVRLDGPSDDTDGDGIMNSFEEHFNTSATDFNEKPSPTLYVNPNSPTNGDGTINDPCNTIQAAVNKTNSSTYDIIQLAPGIYNATTTVSNRDKTIIVSEKGAKYTIVDLENSTTRGFYFNSNNETSLIGVTIKNTHSDPIYAAGSDKTKFYNCIIRDNKDFTNINSSQNEFFNCVFLDNKLSDSNLTVVTCTSSSFVTFNNCLFLNNLNTSSTSDLVKKGNNALEFNNCIIWGNDIDNVSQNAIIRNSIVQPGVMLQGAVAENCFEQSPDLNRFNVLNESSVAIDNGNIVYASRSDFWGQLRTTVNSDIGPFDLEDSDSDDLPDNWERKYFSTLANSELTDQDADSLINRDEYLSGANPLEKDSDSDGVDDDKEFLANMSPDDNRHLYFDFDGDGFTNSYEIHHESDPMDRSSTPPSSSFVYLNPSALVDGNGEEATPYNQLKSAFDRAEALGDFSIVMMKPGVLRGQLNTKIDLSNKKMMLIGEEGALRSIIDFENQNTIQFDINNSRDFVVSGITFRESYYNKDVFDIYRSESTFLNCIFERNRSELYFSSYSNFRFQNCVFRNSSIYSQRLINFNRAYGRFYNCTFLNNESRKNNNALFYSNELIEYLNCLFYNENNSDAYLDPVYSKISYCFNVNFDGVNDNIDTTLNPDPLVNGLGFLMLNSPLNNAGHDFNIPKNDFFGYEREKSIGAFSDYDSDNDQLPDSWEKHYFDDLSKDGSYQDSDDTLVTSDEYFYGSNPTLSDSDHDAIPDEDEIGNGFDPSFFVEVYKDYDADGFPTIYEQIHSSDPLLKNSVPSSGVLIYVDPNLIVNGNGDENTPYNNISSALSAADDYSVIILKSGIYRWQSNSDLTITGKKILLMSEDGPHNTIIDIGPESEFLTFDKTIESTVISGISLINSKTYICKFQYSDSQVINCIAKDNKGYFYINSYSYPRFSNCFFKDNLVATNYISFRVSNACGVDIWGCNFINCYSDHPSAKYVNNSSTDVYSYITNSIFYNDEGNVYSLGAQLITKNTYAQAGDSGIDMVDVGLNPDPKVTEGGYLIHDSPCIDQGFLGGGETYDFYYNPRIEVMDIGMTSFHDADGDELDDGWELLYLTNTDSDTTTNDDLDDLLTGAEYLIGTDPSKTDTDNDGLSDSYEIDNDLSPIDDKEKYEDFDGDGIINSYEMHYNTGVLDSSSTPSATLTIDASLPSNTGSSYNNFSDAIAAAQDYDIIEVVSGTYTGMNNSDLEISHKKMAIIAQNVGECILELNPSVTSNRRGFVLSNNSRNLIIDGLVIRYAPNYPFEFNNDYSQINNCLIELCYSNIDVTDSEVLFKNSIVRNLLIADTAKGVFGLQGYSNLEMINSAVINNEIRNNHIFKVIGSSSKVGLLNSIVWGNSSNGYSGYFSATYSTVQGTYLGEGVSNDDPKINAMGMLLHDSPCINTGLDLISLKSDYFDQDRTGSFDIGPFSFDDQDTDQVSDNYEYHYFSDLNQDADFDGDGLTTLQEYELGTNPTAIDSDTDEISDGDEVVYSRNPTLVNDEFDDFDGDLIPNVFEIFYGSDSNDPMNYPAHTKVIDIASDGSVADEYDNFDDAIQASNDYDIILVRDGIYTGLKNHNLTITDKKILFISENGAKNAILDGDNALNKGFILESNYSGVTFAGLKFQNFGNYPLEFDEFDHSRFYNCLFKSNTQPIQVSNASPKFENCIFNEFSVEALSYDISVGIVFKSESSSEISFSHCNFTENRGVSYGFDEFYEGSNSYSGTLFYGNGYTIKNSIIHNNYVYEMFFYYNTNVIDYSYVPYDHPGQNNINGEIVTEPGMNAFNFIFHDSPCRDSGLIMNKRDYFGQLRDGAVDIGAVEFLDSDNDQLADQWEFLINGNYDLTKDADEDQDYMTNYEEFRFSSLPDSVDIDEDEISDYQEYLTSNHPLSHSFPSFNEIPFLEDFKFPEYLGGRLAMNNKWFASPLENAKVLMDDRLVLEPQTSVTQLFGERELDELVFYAKMNLVSYISEPSYKIANEPFSWFYLGDDNKIKYCSLGQWNDSSILINDPQSIKEIYLELNYLNSTWSIIIDEVLIASEVNFPSPVVNTGYLTIQFKSNNDQIDILEYGILEMRPFHILPEDLDGDGLADSFESFYNIDDPNADNDLDGLSNLLEYENRLNPNEIDSDKDGISDAVELDQGRDPLKSDEFLSLPIYENFAGFKMDFLEEVYGTEAYTKPVHNQDDWYSSHYNADDVLVTNTSIVSGYLYFGDESGDKSIEIQGMENQNLDAGQIFKYFRGIEERAFWVDFYFTLIEGCEVSIFDTMLVKVDSGLLKYKLKIDATWTTSSVDISEIYDDEETWEWFAFYVDFENETISFHFNASLVDTLTFSPSLESEYNKEIKLIGGEYQSAFFDELTISTATPGYFDNDQDGLVNKDELELGTNMDIADTDSDGLNDGLEVNYTDTVFVPASSDTIFENHVLSPSWLSGDSNWVITDKVVKEGNGETSLESGELIDQQTSSFTLTQDFGGSIQFWYKTECKSGYCYLKVYVDDVYKAGWTGVRDWTSYNLNLSPGVRKVEWRVYTNTLNVESWIGQEYANKAWIDLDITQPEFEYVTNLNPLNRDTDGDRMFDGWEYNNGLDPLDPTDANESLDIDSLSNLEEFIAGTDPNNKDTDGDLMDDDYEVFNKLDPLVNDSALDHDQDTLTNLQEFNNGTNPRSKDTDKDGYDDSFEITHGFDPLVDDTDIDSDDDDMPDHWEKFFGVDSVPPETDSDSDGLTNKQEYEASSNPTKDDTDGDGVLDGIDPNPTIVDDWNDPDGPIIKFKVAN